VREVGKRGQAVTTGVTGVWTVRLSPELVVVVALVVFLLVAAPFLVLSIVLARLALARGDDETAMTHDELRMEMLCRLMVELARGPSVTPATRRRALPPTTAVPPAAAGRSSSRER
jgi:hypothetical protein